MFTSGAASQQDPEKAAATRAFTPSFHWELPPAWRSFRENLQATRAPATSVSYRSGVFWKDIFVDQRLNWKSIRRSYALHIIFAGLIYVVSMPFYWQRLEKLESFHDVRLTYVTPNEDLLATEPEKTVSPPKTASIVHRSAPAPRAAPADARQRVAEAVAIAKWSDNHERTILAPDAPRIPATAPMPDLIAWSRTPQAPPVAAVASDSPKLVAPFLDVAAVAPPPDLSKLKEPVRALPQVAAIAPPVQTRNVRNLSRIDLAPAPAPITPEPKLALNSATPVVAVENVNPIAPPPDVRHMQSAAQILPATVQPVAPPPDLSKVANLPSPPLPGEAQPVQAAPDLTKMGTADLASGAMVSLNVTPVAAPAVKPDGQARGTFAGNPQAPANASATPERHAGGSGPGGDSPTATPDDLDIVAKAVPRESLNPARSIAAAVLPPSGNSGIRNSLMAMVATPRVSLPPRPLASDGSAPSNPIDERVFHGRKYHQMELNTPNLTSRSGSWIFRFAELGTAVKSGEWSAPQPVQEVDPAYPADLMRANVQGVVVLYAIIRADGTVDAVKVLEGVDERLDENARKALSAWHFVPGTRNGNPVDLEAVVRIPFRSKRIADLP